MKELNLACLNSFSTIKSWYLYTKSTFFNRIKKETISELESGYKDNLESLSGSGWPSTVKPCPDYNKGLGGDGCGIS